MGNRKNLHNKNAVRVIRSNNSELSGYDKMFKFSVTTASENSLNITLFGTNAGLNTDAIVNYEVFLGDNSIGVFNQDNVAINDINDDFTAASVVTGINPVISVPAAVEVDIYAKRTI